MKISVLVPRKRGRTAELIRWAADNKALIVCQSKPKADAIRRRAEEMGVKVEVAVADDKLHGLSALAIADEHRPGFALVSEV